MREAERRREIRDYYLGISPDEISSYQKTSFDLWASLVRYRRELDVGVGWLELGGGIGDLAAAALDRGYEVLMTDTEVMTVWATDPAGHEAFGRATDAGADERIARWRARSREFLTRWREELMTPYPGTLLSRGDPL